MKKNLILIFAIFIIGGCSAPVKRGSIVTPYPKKYQYVGGVCLEDYKCEFAVEHLSKGNKYQNLILLERAEGRNEGGKAKWLVVNILELPYKEHAYVTLGSCEHANQKDVFIITYLPKKIDRSNEYLSALYFAYKVQIPQLEFVRLNVNDVKCYNTALDADE